jgi:uncharacterized protein YkwD
VGGRWAAAVISTLAAALPAAAAPVVERETASPVQTLNAEVIEQLNLARTDPSGFAKLLRTVPGSSAAEAVAFLEHRMPIGRLTYDPRLGAAAAGHAADQGPRGQTSHTGSDGSSPMARMQRAGLYAQIFAEEVSVGQGSAVGVVRQLIIDDGVVGRTHRADLFDPLLVLVGVGCGPNKSYRIMCVIDLSGAPMAR